MLFLMIVTRLTRLGLYVSSKKVDELSPGLYGKDPLRYPFLSNFENFDFFVFQGKILFVGLNICKALWSIE